MFSNKDQFLEKPKNSNAVLVLENGEIFWGKGLGFEAQTSGELCFNTSMTGYQEILTDPSYQGQIINFTFPHIGNVGTNKKDYESAKIFASGLILRNNITKNSNYRSELDFNDWLIANEITAISDIDTRQLTKILRDTGSQKAIIKYSVNSEFNIEEIQSELQNIEDMAGKDLAIEVTCKEAYNWSETCWDYKTGYNEIQQLDEHIVVIDYGVKHNILRNLAELGYKITVVPCSYNAKQILDLNPDGIFLSNGPGDPMATGSYAIPVIKELINTGLPLFGICLGHQLLALSTGAKTRKMQFGHRGANHPVKNLITGNVEITSQNHGFEVIEDSLSSEIEITHQSLFDGSNEGISLKGKPVFSVQYHPESSPGPEDSNYLFKQFSNNIFMSKKRKAA